MAHAETLASDMGTLASKAAWKMLQIVRMKHTKKNNNILMILLVNKSWIHIHIWDIYILYTYLQYIYIIRTYIVSLHMYVRRNQRSSPLALVAIARTWKMFVAPCISTDHDMDSRHSGNFLRVPQQILHRGTVKITQLDGLLSNYIIQSTSETTMT